MTAAGAKPLSFEYWSKIHAMCRSSCRCVSSLVTDENNNGFDGCGVLPGALVLSQLRRFKGTLLYAGTAAHGNPNSRLLEVESCSAVQQHTVLMSGAGMSVCGPRTSWSAFEGRGGAAAQVSTRFTQRSHCPGPKTAGQGRHGAHHYPPP